MSGVRVTQLVQQHFPHHIDEIEDVLITLNDYNTIYGTNVHIFEDIPDIYNTNNTDKQDMIRLQVGESNI